MRWALCNTISDRVIQIVRFILWMFIRTNLQLRWISFRLFAHSGVRKNDFVNQRYRALSCIRHASIAQYLVHQFRCRTESSNGLSLRNTWIKPPEAPYLPLSMIKWNPFDLQLIDLLEGRRICVSNFAWRRTHGYFEKCCESERGRVFVEFCKKKGIHKVRCIYTKRCSLEIFFLLRKKSKCHSIKLLLSCELLSEKVKYI